MILIPAIDLKDNKCVRLSKGKDSSSIVYNENPVEQAKFFENEGCERIHVIDIDAAFGRSRINTETILKIRESVSMKIELGGGIRNEDNVSLYIFEEADRLIVSDTNILAPTFLIEDLNSENSTL